MTEIYFADLVWNFVFHLYVQMFQIEVPNGTVSAPYLDTFPKEKKKRKSVTQGFNIFSLTAFTKFSWPSQPYDILSQLD